LIAGALAAALAGFCIALASVPDSRRRVTLAFAHPDGAALADAGWTAGWLRWEAVRWTFAGAMTLIAQLVGLPAALALPAALLPSLVIRDRARIARERARRELVRIVSSAHAALRAHAGLVEALHRGVEASDDRLARRPFARALSDFALGASLDDALTRAGAVERDARVRESLSSLALGVAERLPSDRVAELMASLADRLSHEGNLDDEVRARAGAARTQIVIMAAVVPALALYLAATTPGVADTLGSPLGRTLLVPVAAGLEVTGFLLSRRMLSSVLR